MEALLRLLLIVLVALVVFDPQVAFARDLEKQPTATGRGGAAATVDLLGTQAAIDTLRRRRQRGRRGGRGGGRARRDRALFVRHRRRRLHDDPDGGREGHDDRLAREGARLDASRTRSSRTARRSPSMRRAGAACPPACPGTVAGWDRALRRYGTQSLARTLRAGIKVARQGFTVDATFVSQTEPAVP